MANPKISVNKLGEYLEANPSRRKRIVSDQKQPLAFIATRYSRARDIAIDFICSNYNQEVIVTGLEELENQEVETDFQINDNQKSIEFLEFLIDAELPDLQNFSLTKYDGDNPKLNLNGVEVSVNPDIIIRGTIRGKEIVGAIKLHIAQNNGLNNESAKNVATVLHQFVETHIAEQNETTDIKLCLSIDIFSGAIETAPKSFFRRRNYIADACQEIALWWNQL